MKKLTKEELNEWYTLREQVVNGWHMEAYDWQQLVRLNHRVLEASGYIHNKHMMEGKI